MSERGIDNRRYRIVDRGNESIKERFSEKLAPTAAGTPSNESGEFPADGRRHSLGMPPLAFRANFRM